MGVAPATLLVLFAVLLATAPVALLRNLRQRYIYTDTYSNLNPPLQTDSGGNCLCPCASCFP